MRKLKLVAVACVFTVIGASLASATPLGNLSITACTGAGVTVTATTIDWLPAGGGTGCIGTQASTNVTYTGGGPLLGGATGTIQDLSIATVFPVLDFMTFAGHPNLHLDLTSIGPGSANTLCTNSLDPNAPVCSIFAGSPFVLHAGPAGTTVTLAAFGLGRDSDAAQSQWLGTFSTDFAGFTPAQVQGAFLITGQLNSGYSGNFTFRFAEIPEPSTLYLIGLGLGLVAVGRWRPRAS